MKIHAAFMLMEPHRGITHSVITLTQEGTDVLSALLEKFPAYRPARKTLLYAILKSYGRPREHSPTKDLSLNGAEEEVMFSLKMTEVIGDGGSDLMEIALRSFVEEKTEAESLRFLAQYLRRNNRFIKNRRMLAFQMPESIYQRLRPDPPENPWDLQVRESWQKGLNKLLSGLPTDSEQRLKSREKVHRAQAQKLLEESGHRIMVTPVDSKLYEALVSFTTINFDAMMISLILSVTVPANTISH